MARTESDSCPGVLRLHEAADGPLTRIRVPGGRLEPEQLQVLAEAAEELGDGAIELTSRGNVQLRQVRDPDELTARLEVAGLLPSHTHERVRNIVASPLSGRVGGRADVHPLVRSLDDGLRAAARLAELPGRVLFALDDGRGDVSALGPDIGAHAVDEDEFALVLAGRDSGIRVSAADTADVLLAAAHGFLDLGSDQWRLHEIDCGVDRLTDLLGLAPGPHRLDLGAAPQHPIGWFPQDDDLIALGAGVRLGSLPARTAEFLAAVERPVFITPWRSLIITDLDEWPAEQVVRVLAPMGLIFDAGSPWLQVTACAGRPGCAKSHTDVRADATAAIESGRVLPSGADIPTNETIIPAEQIITAGRQHWSGCDRRCGHPAGPVTDVTAGPDGYRVIQS
ncbi:precorrin-3B synthase [Nocardia cyriacigeorgica]|uniref:Precorrin-3B synthase n=1 Tax=Nocardia cyriacigeorgica TaxID=135487 RepID=A0A6P1DAZ6_9NOCA|nr:precorrin-3B synthase [Nocardia cyriacigeorgica]NEW37350.1 precorrin-3B synthase [Nocardia cyriacigeorgica]NEW46789.1 precorrin-3B synthase [Nocardia cyriacigeorgica]NEW50548.1 precorrin-3B synthase [Nocardia cyriacigeorgica]NEW57700.1 precorrin-3B synthase [Nocardia cyriacigeorgica]